MDFGWGDIDVRLDSLKSMSNAKVKYMLKIVHGGMWVEELEEWPKLCVLKELVSGGFEARSVGVRRKKIEG